MAEGPPTDPSKFLPWALLLVMGVVVVIWRLREKERERERRELIIRVATLEEKLAASEESRAELEESYRADVKANAKTLGKARVALAIMVSKGTPAPPVDDSDYDDTTGVSAAVSQGARAEIEQILTNYNESTPPRPEPPRRRQRSRPG